MKSKKIFLIAEAYELLTVVVEVECVELPTAEGSSAKGEVLPIVKPIRLIRRFVYKFPRSHRLIFCVCPAEHNPIGMIPFIKIGSGL